MSNLTYELGPGTLELAGKEHEIKGITLTLVDAPPVCAPVQPQSKEWAREIQAEFAAAKDLRELLRVGTVFHALRYAPDVQQMCLGPFYERVEQLAPGVAGKRVVAVDLSAIYHASYSVCEGKPETSKHTLQMLRNLYAATKPDHFIIALDSRKNWRKDAHPEYKADRPSKPRNFGEFLKECIVELKSKNVQTEEHDGYESDDVMASIAFRAKLLKQEAILVSEDMDLWQCLGGKVRQFRFRSDHKEYRDAGGSHRTMESPHARPSTGCASLARTMSRALSRSARSVRQSIWRSMARSSGSMRREKN